MRYDPTLRALLFPEKDAPVDDFGTDWPLDPLCAELCRLAYIAFEKDDEPLLAAILATAGFTGAPACFHDAPTGAQAFAALGPDGTAFVVFRGTKVTSARDLLADLSAIPVKWAGEGRVHWGFWRCCRSLRPAIDSWLAATPHRRLVLTGHSLGAAMATLMAALNARAELVTFGSPRVGTAAFAGSLAGRAVRRYVDCIDGVTRLPPPLGYAHVGEMVYIDRLGRAHSPPPPPAALRRDRVKARLDYWRKYGLRPRNVPLRSGADHAPVNYISALLGRRDGT